MSLITRVAMFARSPQGKRLTEKAMKAAKDPKNREKIAEARQKLAKKR